MLIVDLVGAGLERLTVDGDRSAGAGDRDGFQPHPVENQRLGMLAIAPDRQPRLHARGGRLEHEVEMNLVDEEGGGLVLGEPDRLGRICAHGRHLAMRGQERQPDWPPDPAKGRRGYVSSTGSNPAAAISARVSSPE